MNYTPLDDARSLAASELAEYEGYDFVTIKGKTYLADSCYHCADCDAPFPSRNDLDDDKCCEDCAADRDAADHEGGRRSDYEEHHYHSDYI